MTAPRPHGCFRHRRLVSLVAISSFFLAAADEPAKPKPLLVLNGRVDNKTGQFSRVAFSPDGKRLASTGQYGTVKVWDSSSGKEILSLKSDPQTAWSVAFSRDGKYLASGNNDGTVKLWNAETGQEIKTLEGHKRIVFSLAISSDGKHLASGSLDGTAIVWDLTTGKEVFNSRGCVVAFSADGKRLAAATSNVTVWETLTWKEVASGEDSEGMFAVDFSPDGKRIASAGTLGNSLFIWDATNGKKLFTIFGQLCVAFSPDGKQIAASRGDLKLWEASTGKELVSVNEVKCGETVCFSPDGKRLAGVGGYTVKVWDVAELIEKGKTK